MSVLAILLSVPAVAAVVLVAALVVVVLLVLLLVRAGESRTFHDAEPEPEPEPLPTEGDRAPLLGAVALRRAFRRAVSRLDRHAAGPEPRYRLPWFLLVGEEGSRPRDLLARAGFVLPFGEAEGTALPEASRCDWWFLERGIVIDLGGDYLEGEGRRGRGLEPVTRLLERARPGRPLDGVVLTVSAEELHRAELAGSSGTSRLEERAGRVCRELWQAQKRLGLTLPVYVLVTGCEVVPGFGDFARAVPAARRREMLGWSNPYAVEAAYRAEWVDEAFEAVGRRLERIQGEVFTEPGNAVDPDRIFVFPPAFATLTGPLAGFLAPVFRPSSYHESLCLRGIYFSGALAGGAATATAGPPVLFVRDLLERKAFPEAGLARPLPAAVVSRNRRLTTLQAAVVGGAILLAAGMWWAHGRLDRSREVLEPTLAQVSFDVAEAKRGSGVSDARIDEWTQNLFTSMAAVDVNWFGSVFLPSSWVSPLDSRIEGAFVEAVEHVVYTAMADELERYTTDLTGSVELPDPWAYRRSAADASIPAPDGPVLLAATAPGEERVEETAEFRDLRRYVDEVRDLERIVPVYNGLPESRDLRDLGQVAEWLFEVPLPEGFYEHRGLYEAAQRRARHRAFALERFRDPAQSKAEALGRRLGRRLFGDNELVTTLTEIETGLDRLSSRGWEREDESGRVRALALELRNLEGVLSEPGIAWALGSRFDPGPDYWRMLTDMEDSPILLGPEAAERVRQATEVAWLQYRRRLERFGSASSGPLLTLSDGGARLSDDLLVVAASLDRFLDQSFAVDSEPDWLVADVPPGSDPSWDLDLLHQAVALYEPYQRFREVDLPRSPPEVRPTLDAAARERLGSNVVSLIARAQGFEPWPEARSAVALERGLRVRIGAFQAAAEPLSRLVAILEELGLWQARRDLVELLVQQGGGLLGQVDRLLTARDPYRPRAGGFNWWDGSTAVGLAAFDAASEEELAGYLELQRRQLETIAREYAEPLVTWLEQTGAGSDPGVRPLVAKWDGILAALDDHEGQKPGNSVTTLEEFITGELVAVTLEGCFNQPGAVTPAAVSDYFLESRERLRRDLLSRCRALAVERAAAQYAELAGLFNRRLAGRYPFFEGAAEDSQGEVSPEVVADFFDRFDRVAPLIRSLSRLDGDEPALPREVFDFVDAMTRVRAFFAPFLDSEEPSPELLYDVEVEFRADRACEEGGYQIIDWGLQVGRERLTNRGTTFRTRWGPGEPVRLTLRWATDSPREPVAPAAAEVPRLAAEVRRFAAVDGRTVTYEFTDRWALLSALDVLEARKRRQCDTPLAPGTLLLAVTTRRAGGDRLDPDPTLVFVRLAVLPPDGTDTLVVPRFPPRAPNLDRSGGKVL